PVGSRRRFSFGSIVAIPAARRKPRPRHGRNGTLRFSMPAPLAVTEHRDRPPRTIFWPRTKASSASNRFSFRPLSRLRGRVREGAVPRHGLAQKAPSPTLPRKREREQKGRSILRIEAVICGRFLSTK